MVELENEPTYTQQKITHIYQTTITNGTQYQCNEDNNRSNYKSNTFRTKKKSYKNPQIPVTKNQTKSIRQNTILMQQR